MDGKLTRNEERIVRLVSLGRTNREVSGELGLSPKTVEWHLSRLYRRLGVRSRIELALLLSALPADLDGALVGRRDREERKET